jgi:hypothetical protein
VRYRHGSSHVRTRTTTDQRSGRRYRKVRGDFVARARATNAQCWLYPLGHCVFDGAPIDYQALGHTPRSPELHHKRPVATHPHLVMEPSNFAIGHARCNRVLGKRSPLVRVQIANEHPAAPIQAYRNWTPASW